MKISNPSRLLALATAGVLSAGVLLQAAPARADKSKTYKYGAIALGAVGAYLLSKGKTVEGAAVVGAGAYAYKKGEDTRKADKNNYRYGDRYGYNNSGSYNNGSYNANGYNNSGYNNSGYNNSGYNNGYNNGGSYNSGYNNGGSYNNNSRYNVPDRNRLGNRDANRDARYNDNYRDDNYRESPRRGAAARNDKVRVR